MAEAPNSHLVGFVLQTIKPAPFTTVVVTPETFTSSVVCWLATSDCPFLISSLSFLLFLSDDLFILSRDLFWLRVHVGTGRLGWQPRRVSLGRPLRSSIDPNLPVGHRGGAEPEACAVPNLYGAALPRRHAWTKVQLFLVLPVFRVSTGNFALVFVGLPMYLTHPLLPL